MSTRISFSAAVAVVLWVGAFGAEALAALTLSQRAVAVAAGGTATLQVSGATGAITARSSDGAVAAAELGNATASGATLTVRGIREGRAAVALRDGSGAGVDLAVTVHAAMTVAPTAMSLSAGSSSRITADNVRSRRIAATSADPGIATAAADGSVVLVTGVAPGSTAIAVMDGVAVASVPVTVIPATTTAFAGSIILGAPTASSIVASILSPDRSGSATIDYGIAPGSYERHTGPVAVIAGTPVRVALEGLATGMRYYYRLAFRPDDGGAVALTPERGFHTSRAPGSTFTFTVQADPHLDENSDVDVYRRTLDNALADAPDFHIDLGDTFMCEKHCTPFSATLQPPRDAATVEARYAYERGNFGRIGHSAALYLVNGNHDGEQGWFADGTAQNLAVWATAARQKYFVNPVPDAFYGGDTASEPFVGQRASWYAWQWGDALFVVLDPYWNTKAKSNSDGWSLTLGSAQYAWLERTLAASRTKFKFVFIHNLVGGLDGQMRGGIEAAPYYEWGGRNGDGTIGFAAKRPGWSLPIHSLLVSHGVSAVFHGHDHVYVKQDLDGIVYQEVPQPSAKNSSNGPSLAAAYHYASGTIRSSAGHVRVTVGPDRVAVAYVRAWLPKDETGQRRNAQIDDEWTIPAPGTPP
jgi:hypothetical protein